MPDFTQIPATGLIALRDNAAQAYYGGANSAGESTMTDDTFDALTAELARRGVEEQVGHGVVGGKVAHKRPMLSLKKVHDVADLEALLAAHPGADYTIEPKWDGLAAVVRYGADGQLETAALRGDGEQGDDILPAIQAIFTQQGLPLALSGAGEVRGEVVMARSVFAKVNEARREAGEPPYSNPRNAASGAIARVARNIGKASKTAELAEAVQRAGVSLTFIPYDAEGAAELRSISADSATDSVAGIYGAFTQYLLPTDSFICLGTGIRSAVEWLNWISDELDAETDGAVLKLTDSALRAELGETSSKPRWALAYKYPNRGKHTVLREVEWAETRTGRVVPTAIFDPVEFPVENGKPIVVSRATLNNIAFLEELDVWIGDTIEVTRANEVIPNVVRRVGEHLEGARPVLDPNGWPVGCGHVVSVSTEPDEDGDPIMQSRLFIRELYVGDKVVMEQVVDVYTDTFGISKVASAKFIGAEHGEYIHDGSQFLLTVADLVGPRDADLVVEWLNDRLIAHRGAALAYRRKGRDLVHDSGRDLVQDISFAAGALDILGFGEDVVRRLVAGNDQIFHFADLISHCRAGELQPFERGTQKLVDKLTGEILAKTSGPQDPAKWIKAAGITGVGYRAGKKLCTGMTHYPAFGDSPSPFEVLNVQATSEILAIDGLGPSAAHALTTADLKDWIGIEGIIWDWAKYQPKTPHVTTGPIDADRPGLPGESQILTPAGVAGVTASLDAPEIDPDSSFPPAPSAEAPLSGKRVLITGTFPTLSRKQAEQRIEELGGDVASSVSRNLDLLVAGEKAGSKLAKAEALGVEVMAAAEFEELGR